MSVNIKRRPAGESPNYNLIVSPAGSTLTLVAAKEDFQLDPLNPTTDYTSLIGDTRTSIDFIFQPSRYIQVTNTKPQPAMGHGIGGRGILMRLRGMANYELMPIVVIVSGVCAMAGAFTTYSLFKKTDVAVFKRSTPHPWVNVKSTEPQKFLTLGLEYKGSPAVETLQKEIGSRK